jgi:hypothetical protein
MSFPSSIDSFTGFTSGETLQAASHAAQSNQEQTAIVAVETKVGTGASTPTANNVLVGNGVGTSTWGQVGLSTGVSGILPVTSGGTGTGTSTGTGSVVLNSTPTTNNETATNLTSTKLNNSSGLTNTGGLTTDTLAVTSTMTLNGALSGTGTLPVTMLYNPYKFSVYRNAALTLTAGAATVVTFDTELFDTGSNYSTSTGKFTAPIAGFYFFSASVGFTTTDQRLYASLAKNGTEVLRGVDFNATVTNAGGQSIACGLLQLATGDYIQVMAYCAATNSTVQTGSALIYFQGFLVSAT